MSISQHRLRIGLTSLLVLGAMTRTPAYAQFVEPDASKARVRIGPLMLNPIVELKNLGIDSKSISYGLLYAAFGLGADDTHIAPLDAGGVALAAIQGLNQKLEERLRQKDVEIQALQDKVAEFEELKQTVRELERRASPKTRH